MLEKLKNCMENKQEKEMFEQIDKNIEELRKKREEKGICPFRTDQLRDYCIEDECTMWENKKCVFKSK